MGTNSIRYSWTVAGRLTTKNGLSWGRRLALIPAIVWRQFRGPGRPYWYLSEAKAYADNVAWSRVRQSPQLPPKF